MSSDNVPPGSSGLFNTEAVQFIRKPLDYCEERKKRYCGNVFKAKILHKKAVFLVGYRELKDMLEDETDRFKREGSFFTLFEKIYGRGVMLLDGEEAYRVRTLLDCAMSFSSLSTFVPLINAELHKHLAVIQKNDLINISLYELIKEWCNEVNMKMWWGMDLSDAQIEILRVHLKNHFRAAISVPLKIPGMGFSKGSESKQYLENFIKEHITTSRNILENMEFSEKMTHDEYLSKTSDLTQRLLLSQQLTGFELTQEELEIQVLWMTSNIVPKCVASAVVSVMIELKEHAMLFENVREEQWILKGKFGDNVSLDQLINSSKFMPQLDHVIEEVLRLHPPLVTLCTQVTAKKLDDFHGYTIPEDWQCFFCPAIANRDNEIYIHPDEFIPQRWESTEEPKCPMHLSFGSGKRKCLGSEWARLLTRMAVCCLIRTCTWNIKADQNWERKQLPVLKPVDGFLVTNFRYTPITDE